MASSESETFAVVDYGSTGTSTVVNLPLTRGMNPGTVLTVIASITGTAQWNVKDRDGRVILHVIAHIDQNAVLFNTTPDTGSGWGPPEKASQMPIKAGKQFTLHIAFEPHGHYIYIDGEELHYFKLRRNTPATTLEINGGQLYFLSYKHNTPKWIIQRQVPINGLYTQEFVTGIQTPYEIQLQGQGCNTLSSLSWIEIIGIVNGNASEFEISLMASGSDIIFHFNTRFSEKWVVRNSALPDWGEEEKTGGMPFEQNKKFVLAIDVETPCYRTYVDGKEFITYNHRTPVESVTRLKISKDVQLFKIMYHI